MSLSRRGLFRSVASPATRSGAHLAARGHEAFIAESWYNAEAALVPPAKTEIRISSNENPLGPGKAALDAIVGKFPEAGRYPFNSQPADYDLVVTIAKKFGVKSENVTLGAGSGEILTNAVRAFTSKAKPLVTANPTFESPHRTAEKIGSPVRAIALTGDMKLDVNAMAEAARGAGLIFFCNPNNPTATVHGADVVSEFVARVRKTAPETVILIDEAYHDYVTEPSYKSAIPLAIQTPNVFVSRTFSKAYGMAGLRVGYGIGHADTIKKLARYKMPYNVSVPGVAAAITSLNDQAHIDAERRRNTEVRDFTNKFFASLGLKGTESNGNFIFMDIRRPARQFREACAQQGVMVARDFPPYEKTHARISIGTMEEMQQAVEVFRKVLGSTTTTASGAR